MLQAWQDDAGQLFGRRMSKRGACLNGMRTASPGLDVWPSRPGETHNPNPSSEATTMRYKSVTPLSHRLFVLLLMLTAIGWSNHGLAATVTRGPYLQMGG